MSLNGGYAMIKFNSTQEELAFAYKSKRPALFYDENQRAHWAVIEETATQSVDEETQEPITLYEYSYRLIDEASSVIANPTLSGDEATLNGLEVDGIKYKVGGGSTLDDIVDSKGNKRFINNYGIWSSVLGMQGIKATWSLNGYNLMFEALGSFSTDISTNNNFTIVSFELPKWILNKISVPFGNIVDKITFKIVGTTGDYTDIPLIISKTTDDKIAFMVVDSVTPTEPKIFRIRYNLIIDNL